jgi:hypothetical protein
VEDDLKPSSKGEFCSSQEVTFLTTAFIQQVYAQYDLDRPIASCSFHTTPSSGKPAFLLEYDAEPLREDILVAYLLQRQRVMSEDRLIDVFVGSPAPR